MPISYHEALQIIQTQIKPLHVTQTLPLLKAINRIASSDVYAKFALPKHPMSLKEGYGIAFEPNTVMYTLLNPPYPTTIPLGYGIRLSTGESIPQGADTISHCMREQQVVFLQKMLLIQSPMRFFSLREH